MSYSIIDTIHIKGLQKFDKSMKLNPIEIKIDGNQILKICNATKKDYKFRYILNGLLFSCRITNEANVLFIICNGLSNARYSLINGKSIRTLGVMHLSQIWNWGIVKGELGGINTTLTDSDFPLNADHFPVSFETTAYNNLLQFYPRFWTKK